MRVAPNRGTEGQARPSALSSDLICRPPNPGEEEKRQHERDGSPRSAHAATDL